MTLGITDLMVGKTDRKVKILRNIFGFFLKDEQYTLYYSLLLLLFIYIIAFTIHLKGNSDKHCSKDNTEYVANRFFLYWICWAWSVYLCLIKFYYLACTSISP